MSPAAQRQAAAEYHATRAVVLIYAGYNVGPLSLDEPGNGIVPGTSTAVNSPTRPIFATWSGLRWWIWACKVSFAAAVRMADDAAWLAMGADAPQAVNGRVVCSDTERALAAEIVQCRAEEIAELARALNCAGSLDHARIGALLGPRGPQDPSMTDEC